MTPVALLLLLSSPARADWPRAGGPEPEGMWEERDDGLSSQDVKIGTGDVVADGSRVEVHYEGMLSSGVVFDSSRERDQPFGFRVGAREVIRGWEEGLVGMQVGGVRRLEIPPGLAYGDRQAGQIPPGSTLYFEVELLSVFASRTPPEAPSEPTTSIKGPADGLRRADVVRGTGNGPKKGRRVCVDYAAWVDGTLVDHTYRRDQCWWFRYLESDVPDALMDGLSGMREGGVRQLWVPAGQPWRTPTAEPIPEGGSVHVQLELVTATR